MSYGPGSMVDLPDHAVIIGGLETWSYAGQIPTRVDEPRLLAKLQQLLGPHIVQLQLPPSSDSLSFGHGPNVTAWEFPNWFVSQYVQTQNSIRKRRLLHRRALINGKHRTADGNFSVVPVRFVRACEKGHIADIDWKGFVHEYKKPDCTRELWIEERGTSGDLENVFVRCDCGDTRSLSQAAKQQLRPMGNCNGERPWLGPMTHEPCGRPNRLLIRSASNAYFAQVLSVISIPDQQLALDEVVRAHWEAGLKLVATGALPLAVAKQIGGVGAALLAHDDAPILAAIARVAQGVNINQRPVKDVEFEALANVVPEAQLRTLEGAFVACVLAPDIWQDQLSKGVKKVVLVHRLREVVAQLGFTRFEATGTDIAGELDVNVERAQLSVDARWLPAVVNRGEGFFVQFDDIAIRAWKDRPETAARARRLAQLYDYWREQHPNSRRAFPGVEYYFLHTLSHLLMTAISLECGYPASSLKERVYCSDGNYGILIFTGASDADGTLGGLVHAARNFKRHLTQAIEMARLCSNDPVCSGQGEPPHMDPRLSGAACHGCVLVSETSCEQQNDFLDRSLVVATIGRHGAEFFRDEC